MRRKNRNLAIVLYLTPAFLIFTLFQTYPVLSGFYYALTSWNGISKVKKFVGLTNFIHLVNDPLVITAFVHTLIFTAIILVIENVLAISFSLLLDRSLRGIEFFRVTIFMPILLSTAVVGYIWATILNPLSGPWVKLFTFLHLPSVANLDPLGSPQLALFTVALVVIWQRTGYHVVIYLAGLQSIPKTLYEVADIAGARGWQKFIHVTFPLIAQAFTINVVLMTIGSFKQFAQVYILTSGGPGNASEVVGTLIYKTAFNNYQFGYGVALSIVLLAMVAIVSIVQFRFLNRREVVA